MNKIVSFAMIVVAFLMSGYVGGSSFSWLFVIMGQKTAAIISFIVGFVSGVLTMFLLLHIVLIDKSDNGVSFSNKINMICKPSNN
jgi:hypothetical protein